MSLAVCPTAIVLASNKENLLCPGTGPCLDNADPTLILLLKIIFEIFIFKIRFLSVPKLKGRPLLIEVTCGPMMLYGNLIISRHFLRLSNTSVDCNGFKSVNRKTVWNNKTIWNATCGANSTDYDKDKEAIIVVSRTTVVLPPCDEGREVFYESAQSVLGDRGRVEAEHSASEEDHFTVWISDCAGLSSKYKLYSIILLKRNSGNLFCIFLRLLRKKGAKVHTSMIYLRAGIFKIKARRGSDPLGDQLRGCRWLKSA